MLDEGEYSRWLRSAYKTLDSARRDLEGGDYNWSCFKAHQAAEKALKAVLWGIGKPKTGALSHPPSAAPGGGTGHRRAR